MSQPVSNSELQTFKGCKRRWWLSYHRRLRLKQQSSTGALALGSRIHVALEAYYTDHQDPVEVHHRLIEEARDALLMEQRDITDLESEAELGRLMLEGYLQWLEETGADSELEVISAEQPVSVPLFNGDIELRGKLDTRVRRKIDNVRLFIDHKTCGNFSDLTRVAYMDEQLLTYHLLEALQEQEDERCDGGIYNMLRKVKRTASARPPFYDRLEVRHNKVMLRSFWTRVHGTIKEIMQTRARLNSGESHLSAAYPTPTRDCHWRCEFYAVCPLFDDGSAAEQMLDDLYEDHDPYDRYSKLEKKEVTT